MDKLKRIAGVVILISLLAATVAIAQTTEVKGDGYTVRIVGEKVVFTLTRAGVMAAAVPGKFNDWKPEAPEAQMRKVGEAFVLEIDAAVVVAAGQAEFKFFTDGKWDPDPNLKIIVEKKDVGYVFVDKVSRPATAAGGAGVDVSKLNLASIDSLPEAALFKGDGYKVAILDGKTLVFVLEKEGEAASIPGFFNSWKPEAPETQMTKKDGKFYFAIDAEEFASAKPMEYKFFVDGKWDPDPNKSLTLRKKDGAWVFAVSPTDKIKGNSNASTEIRFSGRYTAWMPLEMNVSNEDWNKTGDDGIYITDVTHNLDIDMDYKVGSMVLGFTRLKVNYRANDDRRMALDMMDASFMLDDLTIMMFYKKREQSVFFDNPTRSLHKYIDSYYHGIGFYGELPNEAHQFGRNHIGMYISAESLLNLQVLLARRSERENDLLALRAKPVKDKDYGIGLTYIYNANRQALQLGYLWRQNGAFFVNPWNYLLETGYYNHEMGADAFFNLGSDTTLYAEGKLVQVSGGAGTASSVDAADSANNIFATGGLRLKFDNLLLDFSGNFLSIKSATTNAALNDSIIFFNAKGRLGFSGEFKGYAAASLSVMLQSSSDMLFEQKLEGRLESELFDVWFNQSFKSLTSALLETYTLMDIRAGLDWYFSTNLVGLVGARFLMDGNEGDIRESYTALMPLAGIRYIFSDAVRFEAFYGRDLEYTTYLEDNGRTIESYSPWLSSGTTVNSEKALGGKHRITIKADVIF